MSTDLKPCPFCAGAATLDDERLIYVVRCTGCGACVLGERAPEPEEDLSDGYWEPFRQSAVNRWNRRAALAEPEPVVELTAPYIEQEAIETYDSAYRRSAGMEYTGFGTVGCTEHHRAGLRAVLARYGRPAITPIPVSERLPGEGDCDAEGRVWAWYRDDAENEFEGDLWAPLHRQLLTASQNVTHWLPHWALQLPTAVDAPGA